MEAVRSSPDPYVHAAGFWQDVRSRLRIRIPYALCGMCLTVEPGVSYAGPDGPLCPVCTSQVTVRQWFRLPRAERARRVAEFRAADEALQISSAAEELAGITEETGEFHALNGRVNDLWPSVPGWCRR